MDVIIASCGCVYHSYNLSLDLFVAMQMKIVSETLQLHG